MPPPRFATVIWNRRQFALSVVLLVFSTAHLGVADDLQDEQIFLPMSAEATWSAATAAPQKAEVWHGKRAELLPEQPGPMPAFTPAEIVYGTASSTNTVNTPSPQPTVAVTGEEGVKVKSLVLSRAAAAAELLDKARSLAEQGDWVTSLEMTRQASALLGEAAPKSSDSEQLFGAVIERLLDRLDAGTAVGGKPDQESSPTNPQIPTPFPAASIVAATPLVPATSPAPMASAMPATSVTPATYVSPAADPLEKHGVTVNFDMGTERGDHHGGLDVMSLAYLAAVVIGCPCALGCAALVFGRLFERRGSLNDETLKQLQEIASLHAEYARPSQQVERVTTVPIDQEKQVEAEPPRGVRPAGAGAIPAAPNTDQMLECIFQDNLRLQSELGHVADVSTAN